MQTYAAKVMQALQDAGYRFIKADIWECREAGALVDASKSLGDLIRRVEKLVGGVDI